MSEESVLIPKSRYEEMLARLSKNAASTEGPPDGTAPAEDSPGGPENPSPEEGPPGETGTSPGTGLPDPEEWGRTYEEITRENEDLTPPGIRMAYKSANKIRGKKKLKDAAGQGKKNINKRSSRLSKPERREKAKKVTSWVKLK
jgi:hypothetical protein